MFKCKRTVALLLTACLLAGCSLRAAPGGAMPMPGAGADGAPPAHMPALWGWQDPFGLWGGGFGGDEGPLGPGALSTTQAAYGSAGLVGWPSVLISIYLDEADGAAWSEDDIARSRQYLDVAIGWIRGQCAAYSAYPAIYYDDGTPDSGLFVHETYPGTFAGGEESEEGEAFYDRIDALCASLDDDALHERYGTSSVGFLVFLPVAGNAFSIVHEYDSDADYYEYSCLYRYDVWSGPDTWDEPSVYAHELLHLYGAPDLYAESTDPFVTPELVDYVTQNWPQAIMLDTYSPGGMLYDRIDKQLCPLTAYRLGLCSTWPGWREFPQVGAAPAGTFTYDNTPVLWRGGMTAA